MLSTYRTDEKTDSLPRLMGSPRRDIPSQPVQRPNDERPLTFDDIARIGDTKADGDDDEEGQSSTKGTGSAG